MIDPTRLAAIKALCERRVHDGDKYIEVPLYFASAAADPEYGLQALAAEVERIQEVLREVANHCYTIQDASRCREMAKFALEKK